LPRTRKQLLIAYFVSRYVARSRLSDLLDYLIIRFETALSLVTHTPSFDVQQKIHYLRTLAERTVRNYDRIVLIIDGFDDLHLNRERSLAWLPAHKKIKKIILGRQGVLDRLDTPNATTFQVAPLTDDEIEYFISSYFAKFGKSRDALLDLNSKYLSLSLRQPGPLFDLLEELKLAESPENLDRRFQTLSTLKECEELYSEIFHRLSDEFGRNLLRSITLYLLASRGGLLPAELLNLLEPTTRPSESVWNLILRRFSRASFQTQGYIGIYSQSLATAAQSCFKYTADEIKTARLKIANLFAQEFSSTGILNKRTIDELPWQLISLGSSKELCALFENNDFMTLACRNEPEQVGDWLLRLSELLPYDHAYQLLTKVIKNEVAKNRTVIDLINAAENSKLLDLKLLRLAYSTDRLNQFKAHYNWIELVTAASFFIRYDSPQQAKEMLLKIALRESNPKLSGALQAVIQNALGLCELHLANDEQASEHFTKSKILFIESNDHLSAAKCIHNSGLINFRLKKSNAAISNLLKAKEIFEQYQDLSSLAAVNLNLAESHIDRGALTAAMQNATAAFALAQQLFNDNYEIQALFICSRIKELQGDRDAADDFINKVIAIVEKNNDSKQLIQAFIQKAKIRMNLGSTGYSAALQMLATAHSQATQENETFLTIEIQSLANSIKAKQLSNT
jgi:hypothetical protein